MNTLTNPSRYNPLEHYKLNTGPLHEFGNLPETPANIKNIGWSLGNYCPYQCKHCYSKSARLEGKEITTSIVERVVSQLVVNGVETVNLGGNEPLFTNGPNPKNTLLPYVIRKLTEVGIKVGVTTSGITLLYLYRYHRWAFDLLNDVDISLDSPYEEEHNKNRGARVYHQAVEALSICQKHNKPHTCIVTGMKWNFTVDRLERLVMLAKQYDANIRINPLKPIEPKHMNIALSPDMYYAGFAYLLRACQSIELGEPPIAAVTDSHTRRCPCGRTSFRIHSIAPNGSIYVSPCVYLHDYKVPLDLLECDLTDIIQAPQFRVFRQRHANPEMIDGCNGCTFLDRCGGGCAARAYLYHLHETGEKSMRARDPYCLIRVNPQYSFPQKPSLDTHQHLVHMDYLCTWIGKPL